MRKQSSFLPDQGGPSEGKTQETVEAKAKTILFCIRTTAPHSSLGHVVIPETADTNSLV